jgi:hypothetical protein
MPLRFIGRIGIVSSLVLFACTESEPGDKSGTGGTGTTTAGTNSGGTSSAGTSSAGTSSGGGAGSSAGGQASAGMSTGGAGSSSGGSGGTSAGTGGGGTGGAGGAKSKTTFFVTSDTSMTGKLGGLAGADKRCQDLAMKAGFGDHTFHAYLSTSTVNAKDRIGMGPWVNSLGTPVADSVAALHAAVMKGNPDIFVDENKMKIHGQWDSAATNEHDILTGTMPDGTVQGGKTCMDWTSDAANMTAQVGHSDGMGPGMATTGTYSSWNSSHENGSCADTAPKGGAGRIYCFATD